MRFATIAKTCVAAKLESLVLRESTGKIARLASGSAAHLPERSSPVPSRRPDRALVPSPICMVAAWQQNKTGRLDYKEVRNALAHLGHDLSAVEAVHALRRFDRDGAGFLEFDEFSTLVASLSRGAVGGANAPRFG